MKDSRTNLLLQSIMFSYFKICNAYQIVLHVSGEAKSRESTMIANAGWLGICRAAGICDTE